MPKPDMLNLRTAESTVTLTEKPQGVDYSIVRDLTLPEYFSLSEKNIKIIKLGFILKVKIIIKNENNKKK